MNGLTFITHGLEGLAQFIQSVPVWRIIYSLVLIVLFAAVLGLSLSLAKEFLNVWDTGKIVLSDFAYYSNSGADGGRGTEIRQATVQYYGLVRGLIANAPRSRSKGSDEASFEKISAKFQAQATAQSNKLSQIDINIQGVNISGLLAAARNFITPSNTEIRADVFANGGARRVFVTFSGDPQSREQQGLSPALSSVNLVDTIESDDEVAFQIACFLIWAQWGEAPENGLGISRREFCDWAKILMIQNAMRERAQYQLDAIAGPDVEFVRTRVELAANGRFHFPQLNLALSRIIKTIRNPKLQVRLGDRVLATADAVRDIVALAAVESDFQYAHLGWYDVLKSPVTDPAVVDWAYYGDRIKTDEDPSPLSSAGNDGAAAKILRQSPNVARISFTENGATLTMSGLVLSDDYVLTVLFTDPDDSKLPDGTVAQIVSGKLVGPYRISDARMIGRGLDSGDAFYLLKVPGIHVVGPAPRLDFDANGDELNGVTLVVTGHLRNRQALFRAFKERGLGEIGSGLWYLVGHSIEAYYSATAGNLGFDLNLPTGEGLRGSPVFSVGDGKVVGLVGSSRRIGTNLALAGGMFVSVLRKEPTFAWEAKGDRVVPAR